ncbi:glycosyltransferase family 4 protein [Paracoccus sp. NGMCC 1.201697]|uniref:Glycosyltransferase family 4 protein n=1 Tax=Paracoccus broussonetiae subsp. drimophilus TaxID=3373869 RepID=A0ABW7LJ15_9RHOB
MTRITFLMPQLSLNGGIRVIGEYGRELTRQGHDVAFVAREPQQPRLRDILRGRAFRRRSGEDLSDYFFDVADRLRTFPARRKLRASDLPDADFLVCSWWETVEWAAPMPASKGRLAHLMQGYEMFPWVPRDRVARTYEADTIKVAVSRWIADMVETNHGRTADAVIHNAVDAARFAFRPTRENDCLTLGMVYSQPSIKNSDLAFPLLDLLDARGIKAKLVVFGTDQPADEHLSRADTVFHRRPDQSRIPSIYQGCDLWLFPSLEEGFGLPLIEAMACGTPVVSGIAGVAPELVRDAVNGYLCDPTPDSFAAAITRYMDLSPAARQEMSRAAHQTVANWSWADAAGQFIRTLDADHGPANARRG